MASNSVPLDLKTKIAQIQEVNTQRKELLVLYRKRLAALESVIAVEEQVIQINDAFLVIMTYLSAQEDKIERQSVIVELARIVTALTVLMTGDVSKKEKALSECDEQIKEFGAQVMSVDVES